jgi:hypothetical protein
MATKITSERKKVTIACWSQQSIYVDSNHEREEDHSTHKYRDSSSNLNTKLV